MARRKGKRKASTVAASGGLMDGVLAKGLAHPSRAEILAYLNDYGIASPIEMSRAGVGQNMTAADPKKRKLSNIAYHVRVLEELGLIRLVKKRAVRGATEHFYEATSRMLLDLEEWSKLPPRAKNDVSIKAVEETLGRAGKALSAGTFDSFNERAVINLPLRLDKAAFVQLAEEMTDFAFKRCEQLQADSVNRAGGDVAKLMHASASLLLYESPPPKP
jgi:DNA-binding transcriptional ArsR family regulator